MMFHSKRATALAALVLSVAMALTACGRATTPAGEAGGGGDKTTVDTFLPKNLGNPYFDISDARWQEGGQGVRRHLRPGRSAGGQPGRPGAVHQHRRPAGRRRTRGLGQRPERHLRRARPGAATPAPRSSPSTPTPTPSAATSSSTRPAREGIAKAQVDLIAEQIGDEGEIAILSATRQRDQPERMDRDDGDGAEGEPPEHQARRHRLRRRRRPDLLRQDRRAAAVPPEPQGHHLADHRRHRGGCSLPVGLGQSRARSS